MSLNLALHFIPAEPYRCFILPFTLYVTVFIEHMIQKSYDRNNREKNIGILAEFESEMWCKFIYRITLQR